MKLVNIFNSKRTLFLFCRNDKGELEIKEEKSFFPYYYEPCKEGKSKSYNGIPLKKIFVSEPRDVPRNRTDGAFEADILFTKRYMIDKIDQLEKCPIKYAFVDIETLADELPDVQEAKYPVSCISVYNAMYKSIQTFYLQDYETEFKMVDSFVDYLRKEKFDLLLGWNFTRFDFPYLCNRFPDFAENISPIGQTRYGNGETYYPAGISIIDYLAWFKKITLNRESEYSLDYIAQKHLKQPPKAKVDFSKLSPELKMHNIEDVKKLAQLEEKFKLIPYFDEVRRLAKVEWEDMIWNSRTIDMLLLQEAKNQDVVLPMKPDEKRGTLTEKEEFAGAYREVYEAGAKFNIGKYDLSSAYPYAIIDFCLDPANIISLDYDPKFNSDNIISPLPIAGAVFQQNPNALLPTVVKKLIILKNDIKKKLSTLKVNTSEYKNIKTQYEAIKTIVNSAYGVFGNRFFRLYDKRVASATTSLVRSLLHYAREKLELAGHKVLYVDTDSVFIDSSKDLTELCNKLVAQWAKETFNKDKVNTEFAFEGIYEKILILTMCRYIGYLRKTNGELEEEIKGVEAKRKDSTKYMKKFQKEFVNKILNKEDKIIIFAWIKEQIEKFKENSLEDIAFPCKLSKPLDEYKNVPIFVRASQYANELVPEFGKKIGDLFYYIYVKSDEYEEKTKIVQYLDGKKLTPSHLKSAWKEYFKEDILVKNMDKKKKEELIEYLIVTRKIEHKTESAKGKNKNVMALNSEHKDHVKNVDWEMMLQRNVIMKLSTIFEAMGWDIKEII